jgi:hypothetical protein
MPDPLSRAQAEIRAVFARSPTMNETRHAEDTLAWLLRLRPGAGPALALAALGHDIDHADPHTLLQRGDFESYGEFKDAHAARAATVLRALLMRCGVSSPIVQRACWLVEHHECGGDADADLLRDADNLSYFRVNLPAYFDREGRMETLRRCRWSYECLTPRARQYVGDISHRDPRLNRLLRETMMERWA